jgi:type IV secretory pathway VirJ component
MRSALATALPICLLLCAPLHAEERISHGHFEDLALYKPIGEVKEFVLFLSGDGGWDRGVVELAQALVDRGAMVAGISTPQLLTTLEDSGTGCLAPDGDLENLAHYLQGYATLPTYFTPLLVGYASGATLAYAMLAQAPTATFAGALSLGFCPELDLTKPLCKGEDVQFTVQEGGRRIELLPDHELETPWIALQGGQDQICGASATKVFVDQVPGATVVVLPEVGHEISVTKAWLPEFLTAYGTLSATHAEADPAPPANLADLPIVEVPAGADGDVFAIMLSGDGGWAGLDKDVAAALAKEGIPVVGLDSLRYFWTARSPEGLAADLDRVLRYYAAYWKKSRALLIGYSQGADVLPFAINRLAADSKSLVTETVLIGLGENALFEFHLSNWAGGGQGGRPILPEAQKLSVASTLCLYGVDENDSLCPRIPAGHVKARSLPGGHHFDGDYDMLAELILARFKTP